MKVWFGFILSSESVTEVCSATVSAINIVLTHFKLYYVRVHGYKNINPKFSFLKRNKNTFIPFLLHTLHLNYGSHQWLHQLLSKLSIIFSINEFVHRMSENNENCPSEPHVTSTVGNANILR